MGFSARHNPPPASILNHTLHSAPSFQNVRGVYTAAVLRTTLLAVPLLSKRHDKNLIRLTSLDTRIARTRCTRTAPPNRATASVPKLPPGLTEKKKCRNGEERALGPPLTPTKTTEMGGGGNPSPLFPSVSKIKKRLGTKRQRQRHNIPTTTTNRHRPPSALLRVPASPVELQNRCTQGGLRQPFAGATPLPFLLPKNFPTNIAHGSRRAEQKAACHGAPFPPTRRPSRDSQRGNSCKNQQKILWQRSLLNPPNIQGTIK